MGWSMDRQGATVREYQEYNRRRFPVVGREDRWQRLVPEWLRHLFPPTTRAAVKRFLSLD